MAQAYTIIKKKKAEDNETFGKLCTSFVISFEDAAKLDAMLEESYLSRSQFFQIVTHYAIHKKNKKGNSIFRDMNKFYLEGVLNDHKAKSETTTEEEGQ